MNDNSYEEPLRGDKLLLTLWEEGQAGRMILIYEYFFTSDMEGRVKVESKWQEGSRENGVNFLQKSSEYMWEGNESED